MQGGGKKTPTNQQPKGTQEHDPTRMPMQEEPSSAWGHEPEISACEFLMGKRLLRPRMLLVKTVEAPLTTTTQARVRPKKRGVQADVSTFTSTVITRKTESMTKSEARMRTLAGTLGTARRNGILPNPPQTHLLLLPPHFITVT